MAKINIKLRKSDVISIENKSRNSSAMNSANFLRQARRSKWFKMAMIISLVVSVFVFLGLVGLMWKILGRKPKNFPIELSDVEAFDLNIGPCDKVFWGELTSNHSKDLKCTGLFLTTKFMIFSDDCPLLDQYSSTPSDLQIGLLNVVKVSSIGNGLVNLVELEIPKLDKGSTCVHESFDSNLNLINFENAPYYIANGTKCWTPANGERFEKFYLSDSACHQLPSLLRERLVKSNDTDKRMFFSGLQTKSGNTYLNGIYLKAVNSSFDEFYSMQLYLEEIRDHLKLRKAGKTMTR